MRSLDRFLAPFCSLLASLVYLPIAFAQRPNFVLVMADDQGWGDMAYQGHRDVYTPHFDALAREGVRFDRFYAAAPVCSPTRGSVLTGRTPNRYGCFSFGQATRQVKWELYDLAADPAEANALPTDQTPRFAAMKAALESWLQSVARSLNGEDYRPGGVTPAPRAAPNS